MKRRLLLSIPAVLSLLALLSACGGSAKKGSSEGTSTAAASVSQSLQSEILSVTVASPPVVTFNLFDPDGNPLTPTASSSPAAGQARVRFTIARIESDGNYKNYIKSSTATQPTYDSGGTFATVGTGTYTYTFAKNIDNSSQTLDGIVVTGSTDKTHTVAAQIERTVTDNTNLVTSNRSLVQAANPYLNFRPDGGTVTVTREITPTSACNECHGLLGFHGGARREVPLCILCHYPGVTDPQTTNTVDMKSLIHKIHMGAKLPSNVGGGDFTIIGYGGSVNTYKTVAYPYFSTDNTVTRTPADCTMCHKTGTDLASRTYGTDVARYKSNPTINKCTSCHDTTTFDGSTTITVKTRQSDNTIVDNTITAVPHTGGIIPTTGDNTSFCILCHDGGVVGVNEFDNTSIVGAHTIVENSSRNLGANFQILSVDNGIAGMSPAVRFKVTRDDGTVINPSATSNVTSWSIRMGYIPSGSSDFANNLLYDNTTATRPGQPTSFSLTGSSANVARLVDNGDGSYTANLALENDALPSGITGIGVVSLEGRVGLVGTISTGHKGTRTNSSIRFSGPAAQWFFDLSTGAQVTDALQTRRVAAQTSKCNVCHNVVRLHGGSRINVEECVICHNPNGLAADNTTTIDFKVMIHKIHSGEHLTQTYSVGGTSFNEVRYPQDRRNCLACHVDVTPAAYGLPLRTGVQGTSTAMGTVQNNSSDDTKIGAMRAVCTSCHDDTTVTLPHVLGQTSGTTELCASCHTTGLTFGPDQVHRAGRPGPFPVE